MLEYHLGGKDISEVLAMPVDRGAWRSSPRARRALPAAHAILDALADVGLGYLRLGQPLTTLSGGERQRLKLATHMAEKGGVYVLDEPTTGLHLADVEQLLALLDRLVDSGKSVIVIEHHQAVMAHADWIIDLGPGAGHDGGRIVFEGTPGRPRRRPLDPHRRAPRGVRRPADRVRGQRPSHAPALHRAPPHPPPPGRLPSTHLRCLARSLPARTTPDKHAPHPANCAACTYVVRTQSASLDLSRVGVWSWVSVIGAVRGCLVRWACGTPVGVLSLVGGDGGGWPRWPC